MPLDRRIERFLRLLNSGDAPRPAMTVNERRAGLEELMRFGGPAVPLARVEERTIPRSGGHLPVRIYTPAGTKNHLSGLVYFHGGGFVAGSLETHDGIARNLAQSGNCRIVSVGYRLAPEHPFPAAVEDARCAVSHVAAHASDFGIESARLGVCGDSAGGALAAATCQALAGSLPPLRLQLLLCPILDYSRSTESRREFASGYLVGQDTLDHDLRYYLPAGTDPADPRISPLRAADLAGLPRTIVHTAEFDPLRDEGQNYFQRLTGNGAAMSYTCHAGMIHLFYALGAVVPYARRAFEQIGGEIRAAMV